MVVRHMQWVPIPCLTMTVTTTQGMALYFGQIIKEIINYKGTLCGNLRGEHFANSNKFHFLFESFKRVFITIFKEISPLYERVCMWSDYDRVVCYLSFLPSTHTWLWSKLKTCYEIIIARPYYNGILFCDTFDLHFSFVCGRKSQSNGLEKYIARWLCDIGYQSGKVLCFLHFVKWGIKFDLNSECLATRYHARELHT